MAFEVFLSHSVLPDDLRLIEGFRSYLYQQRISCFLAPRDSKWSAELAQKIEPAIDRCNCLVALLAIGGPNVTHVEQELGYAHNQLKHCIVVAEKGVDMKGIANGEGYVDFDPADPPRCMATLAVPLLKLKAERRERAAVGWAVSAFCTAVAMRGQLR